MCEVGWPHTYFSHKDEGLARRPPAGRKRRVPDPGRGTLSLACRAGWGMRSLGRRRAAGSLVALRCLGEVEGAGPGRRPQSRGAGAEGPPGEEGIQSAARLVHCCILGPADPDLEIPAAAAALPAARCPPCLPGGRMGSVSRSRLLPGRQRRGRAALKGGSDTVSCLQVTFLRWTLLCFFESVKARGLGDVCAEVSTFSSGFVIAS